MKTLGTPCVIDTLLHYHCFPAPHPRADAPAIVAATRELLKAGALQRVESALLPIDRVSTVYQTTALGAAWVRALAKVPIPTVAYLDDAGQPL